MIPHHTRSKHTVTLFPYTTLFRSFRVGCANPPVPVDACHVSLDQFGLTGAPTGYDSDKVASIELGSKNNLFDRRLQIAASVYSIKWKGIQQGVSLPSCGIQFTDNLGSARSRGLDRKSTRLNSSH